MNISVSDAQTEDAFPSLLELAANNDIEGFKRCVDQDSSCINQVGVWYGRQKGSNKMVLQHRTCLMVAATYGSIDVLKWILSFPEVDVNESCDNDNTTPLHCAASGGSMNAIDAVKLLLEAGADPSLADADGFYPLNSIFVSPKFPNMKFSLQNMLNVKTSLKEGSNLRVLVDTSNSKSPPLSPTLGNGYGNGSPCYPKKEYPADPSLPDIKNSIYSTDEFRMFSFKVRPCSRAYSHDWTECPFVHPGENARRRDPRKYHYSCVPCPDFRKGAPCRRGDMCEYAHGVFESWLHPAQYRTRLCKDGTGCNRRVCFFAHMPEEVRPLYVSVGSTVPSPRSSTNSMEFSGGMNLFPGSPSSVHVTSPSPFTPPMSPGNSSPNMNWLPQQKVPSLQLLGSNLQSSRLRSSLNARDFPPEDLSLFHDFDNHDFDNHDQQMLHELSLMSRWARPRTLTPNFEGNFSVESSSPKYFDPALASTIFSPTHKSAVFSQFQQQQDGLSPIKTNFSPRTIDHSPLQASYGVPSPGRSMSPRGIEPISPMSARLSVLSQRENYQQKFRSFSSRDLGSNAAAAIASLDESHSNLGSLNGTPDGVIAEDEFVKLRRSSSFELLNNGEEPDLSWVHSLVKEPTQDVKDKTALGVGTSGTVQGLNAETEHENAGVLGAWIEQMQLDQLMFQ